MRAVILAAGLGSRLSSLTDGKPKCLVEIGGRPLIYHQLEALADHGVGPVLCVLGYRADEVRQVIGDRAEVLVNQRYAETNSLYSLWLARQWIEPPFLLLNSDLFFDPRILDRILEERGNLLAYDSTSSRGREQTKVAIKARHVVDLGKDVPVQAARGESLGLLRFEEDGTKAMLETADHLIRQGHERAWVTEATRMVCNQVPVYGVNVAGHAWTEIDFPYDLDVARREVWPAIWTGRWRRLVYWKRTRWAALAAFGLLLGLSGWFANTAVGPASVDWETVPVSGGAAVRLAYKERTQRWWVADLDETVTAQVEGAADVQVRLLLPPEAGDSLRYVVAVAVDGKPHDWRALTAVPDSTSRLGDALVGDRDRIRLPLSPGLHEIGVSLVAGHSGRLLVRVRQREERQD